MKEGVHLVTEVNMISLRAVVSVSRISGVHVAGGVQMDARFCTMEANLFQSVFRQFLTLAGGDEQIFSSNEIHL